MINIQTRKISFLRNKKLRFLLVLFLFTFANQPPIFSQIDSLEQRLTQLPENRAKVDVLNQLSYAYHTMEIDKTFFYANQSLALSDQLKYIKGKALALHGLSIANGVGGNNILSKELNKKVIHLADSIQAFDVLIQAYNVQALNLDKEGKPDETIKIYQKALELAHKENDQWGLSVIPLNLGNIHAGNEHFDKARHYYEQAIFIGEQNNDLGAIAWGYRAIAETYLDEKKFSEATSIFEKSLKIAEEIKDLRSIAFTKEDLSLLYLETGKMELAEKYALDAIHLIKEVGDKEGIVGTYANLMDIYLETDQPDKAIQAGYEALEVGEQNVVLQIAIHDFLSEAYAQKGDFQKAYEINVFTQANKDSLDYERRMTLATELDEKYQSKKKKAENALLRAEQEKQSATIFQQKLLNAFLIIITFLLTLLGFIAYKAYRIKQKNNKILEEKVLERTQELLKTNTQLIQSNEELAKFAYVASHDLREPLRNIINFTQLLQNEINNPSLGGVEEYMNIIHANTSQMNRLILDTLEFTRLSNKSESKENIDLNKTLKNIESAILTTLKKKKASIEINKILPNVQANDSLMFSLFKNLIENGIKYNESLNPSIKIDYEAKAQHYIFSVADNGIGIPKAFQKTIFEMFKRLQNREKYEGSGLGLSNCKKILSKLGGKIWVESDGTNGSTFFFTIPISRIDRTANQSSSLTGLMVENASLIK